MDTTNPKIKIAIGLPTYGSIKTATVMSLFKAIKNLPYEWNVLSQTGCYIQDNRISIVKMAQKLGSTHLLFVDADMKFDAGIIENLLKRGKEIIGADYNYRKLPQERIAQSRDVENKIIWEEHENGLIECAYVGTGMMLIDMKVFDNIPEPWFVVEHYKDGTLKWGEDVWFCKEARNAGYKIWLDTTLKVKHIGEYEY